MAQITRDYYTRTPQTDGNGNIITDPETDEPIYDEALAYSKNYEVNYGVGTEVSITLGPASEAAGDTNYKKLQSIFSGIDEAARRVEQKFIVKTYDKDHQEIAKSGILRHLTLEPLYSALVDVMLRGANDANYTIEKMMLNAMSLQYNVEGINMLGVIFLPDGSLITTAKVYLN